MTYPALTTLTALGDNLSSRVGRVGILQDVTLL